jgi:hypothetical protein
MAIGDNNKGKSANNSSMVTCNQDDSVYLTREKQEYV